MRINLETQEVRDYLLANVVDFMFGVNKYTGKLARCSDLDCSKCMFEGDTAAACGCNKRKWLLADADNSTNWEEVPVDTPVMYYSAPKKQWCPAHFAGMRMDAGELRPAIWQGGRTSHTTTTWGTMTLPKEHLKLYEVREV